MSEQDDPLSLVEVPHTALEPGTLRRLIEEFVTRDTTDYGLRERALDEKVADVMRQLHRGEVSIVLEQATNAINLVTAVELERRQSGQVSTPASRHSKLS